MAWLRGLQRSMAGPNSPGMGAVPGSIKEESENEVGRAASAPMIDMCRVKNTCE